MSLIGVEGGALLQAPIFLIVAIVKNDSPYGMFRFETSPLVVREARSPGDPAGQVTLTVQRLQGSEGTVSIAWQLEPMARSDFEPPFQVSS